MSVAAKATIIAATAKNTVVRPNTSFKGRDLLKSCSCILDVIMERITTTEVSEKQSDNMSEVVKVRNAVALRSKG
jgi:hypothetical protein